MKLKKLIGGACVGALLASAIPFIVKKDQQEGTLEIRSLLWGIRMFPGKDKNHIAFAIPGSAVTKDFEELQEDSAEETPAEETPAEEAEAPVAEAAEEAQNGNE